MNHILVICDEEDEYAAKLADYLNLKEGFPFDVRCFQEAKVALDFIEKQSVEVLLCSENLAENFIEKSKCKIFIMQDQKGNHFPDFDKIWKYQSCETIICELMKALSDTELEYGYIGRKKPLKTIGFYSPVKRNLQTTMAILLGEILGKRAKTLYINLESYAVLEDSLNIQFTKDLSDILYDMQGSLKGEEFYLASVMAKYQELYLLPAMANSNDLVSIPETLWLQFLRTLEAETDYEYFLIDFSDGIQGLYELLRQCDCIYEVATDSTVARQKIKKYHKQLKISGYEDVTDKIKSCKIPYYTDFPEKIEEAKHTDFGKYVRNLVKDAFYARV